jgi:hypothetical protein
MRNFVAGALIVVFALAAGGTALALPSSPSGGSDIQMLPPLQFDMQTPCVAPQPEMLAWDGTDPVNCIPGLFGDSAGNFSVTMGNLSATKQFMLDGVNVTGTIVNLAAQNCPGGEALTTNGPGNFQCIAVADIVGVGKTYVPTCGPAYQIYFDGTGFSCQLLPVPPPPPVPPICAGTNALQWNGTAYTCVSVLAMVPALPNCADGQTIIYSGGQPTCTTPATGSPVVSKDTGPIVGLAPYQNDIVQGMANASITPTSDPADYASYTNECINGTSDAGSDDPAVLIQHTDCQRLICYALFNAGAKLYDVTGGCTIGATNPPCAAFTPNPMIRLSCFY